MPLTPNSYINIQGLKVKLKAKPMLQVALHLEQPEKNPLMVLMESKKTTECF